MIYIDARQVGDYGIGRCTKEILKHSEYDKCFGENVKELSIINPEKIVKSVEYKERDKQNKRNVYHFLANYIDRRCLEGTTVVTIHDIIPLRTRDDEASLMYKYIKQLIFTIKRADLILTVSEYSRNDIADYFGISKEKIKVIKCGVSGYFFKLSKVEIDTFREKKKINGDKKIIFNLTAPHKHKNLCRLIEAYKYSEIKNSKLVIAGELRYLEEEIIALINKLGLQDQVILEGKISDKELRLWYNIADIFVFPSLYEGFGIPPLEAMLCGTPVVASNVTSIPEVLEDAAAYFNPYDIEDIAKKIKEVINNEELAKSLVSKGFEQAAKFSWEKYGEEHSLIYDMLLRGEIGNDSKIEIQKPDIYEMLKIYQNGCNDTAEKFQIYCNMYDKWLSLIEHEFCIGAYFINNKYKNVVIYGMGRLGIHLFIELKKAKINISFVLDQKNGNFNGIERYSLDDNNLNFDGVDVVVITPVYEYAAIREKILSKFDVKVVSLENILYAEEFQ